MHLDVGAVPKSGEPFALLPGGMLDALGGRPVERAVGAVCEFARRHTARAVIADRLHDPDALPRLRLHAIEVLDQVITEGAGLLPLVRGVDRVVDAGDHGHPGIGAAVSERVAAADGPLELGLKHALLEGLCFAWVEAGLSPTGVELHGWLVELVDAVLAVEELA